MKIGFIGLGIMGKPMVRNLMKHGHELVVFDVVKPNVDMMVSEGARAAENTAALAAECAKNLKKAQLLRGDQEVPVLFAAGTSSMIIKAELREFISAAEREMQRNKEHSRREDRAFLLDYIERFRGERVSYTDDRINVGAGS